MKNARDSARVLGFASLGLVSCLALVVACSASESSADGYDGNGGSNTGVDGLNVDGGPPPSEPPPEEEDDSSYRAPVVTGRYLWSANPDSGRVALIDGEKLGVRVFSAGLYPTHLAAVPNEEGVPSALVLNVGSEDVSWFRVEEGGVWEQRLRTHAGANRLEVASNGSRAIAYSVRETEGPALDPTEGLQEISVIELDRDAPRVTRLAVGYRPSRVTFVDEDARALVVSEDGLTVIELGEAPEVSLFFDLGPESGRDVSIPPDGTHALVRREGETYVEVLTLDEPAESQFIELGAVPTDLDLAPDGRALAVFRESSSVASFVFPDVLDGGAIETATFSGETFGSAALTRDGKRAVLYTNAVENDRVTLIGLEEGEGFLEGETRSVEAPVRSVATTPDGKHAVVLGRAKSFAVLSLENTRFPRVVGTAAPVLEVALSNGVALVTATEGSVHTAHLVRLPTLSVTTTQLATTPLSSGVLDEYGIGFVAQKHPEGRVTFFDEEDFDARTLTGFELSAEVVDR